MKKQFSLPRLQRGVSNVLGALFLFALLSSSCSKDDDSNGLDADLGEVTITVSGDINGTFKGMADFAHLRLNNMQTWEISMHDISPQTFSSSIITMDVGELERPSPGTYSIGDGINTGFSGIFIDVVDGAFHLSEEYATLESDDFGTLTITSSNENNVKGHFEFTALLTDMDDSYNTVILKTIHVQGEFSANKRKY